MSNEKGLQSIEDAIPVSIHDPGFYPRLFNWIENERLKNLEDESPVERVILDQMEELSQMLHRSEVQEGSVARNLIKSRLLAQLLINEEGDFEEALNRTVLTILRANLYTIGPGRHHDGRRQEHILKVLTLLDENQELRTQLLKIDKPFRNPVADDLIRDTLALPPGTEITDSLTRRAVLSAWLTFLRQNVGSCFGTAPAIMIHGEQPHLFLKDIQDLLNTGRLQRVVEGSEYVVPLSPSWGVGDILRTFVLSIDEESGVPIWESPGLLSAMESTHVIDASLPLREKVDLLKTRVLAIAKEALGEQKLALVSVQKMIQMLLLNDLGLTEQEVQEYRRRPKQMMPTDLTAPVPGKPKKKGKDQLCRAYEVSLERAIKSFKAVTDNALLKAWEFTIASLSETKHDFSTWNLYASLGLGPNDEGGIGGKLFEILKEKVDELNQEVHRIQEEIEPIYSHVKAIEVRLRRASSEDEAKWVKSEYQSRVNELRTYEEMRDKAHRKAGLFANLFDFLVNEYLERFGEYFQEIYDADMHDVKAGPYDDSPAGFRLLYKHGRALTQAWTMIRTPDEFIEAISGFFLSTESDILSLEELEPVQTEVRQIISSLVAYIRNPEFIETAFHRMAVSHGTRPVANPLEHLDQIEKKPWAYTSGGTMNQLLSCYYYRSEKPTEDSRWVEEPMELLVFILDQLKKLPEKAKSAIEANPELSIVMHSPTHAFLLKPGWQPLREGWSHDVYTYTWVRDHWLSPHIERWSGYRMDAEMIRELYERLVLKVPEAYRQTFERSFAKLPGSATPEEFRDYVLTRMRKEKGIQVGAYSLISEDDLDQVLFQSLPMFDREQIPSNLRKLLSYLPSLPEEKVEPYMELYDRFYRSAGPRLITAEQLQRIAKSLMLLDRQFASTSVNIHREVAQVAAKQGLAMPQPILFADTNWVKEYFAFVFNPGTLKLEFWRTNEVGRSAVPMHSWRQWLDGSQKKPDWGIFIKPHEYWRV